MLIVYQLILLAILLPLYKTSAKSLDALTTKHHELDQQDEEIADTQTQNSNTAVTIHENNAFILNINDYIMQYNAKQGIKHLSNSLRPLMKSTHYSQEKSEKFRSSKMETPMKSHEDTSQPLAHSDEHKDNAKSVGTARPTNEQPSMVTEQKSVEEVKNYRVKRYLTEDEGFPSRLSATNIDCPTDECDCRMDSNGSYILNCRFKSLKRIPSFKPVPTVFKMISFFQNDITEVKTLAFKNLKVEKIDLIDISLSKIEYGAFIGLEITLKELTLQGNGQTPIPFQQISNLKMLQILRLKNFNQTRLANLPSSFENLRVLKLSKIMNLSQIDSTAFAHRLHRLQEFGLDNSALLQIPVDSLRQITSLQSLALRFGQLTNIYDYTFEQFHLKSLDLHRNKISMIKPDAFLKISNTLERLDLSFNSFDRESLESLSSKTWVNLQYLSLSYNNLQYIPGNVFRNMPKLQYLLLEEVHLTQVSPNLFGGLSNLFSLDLSYNRIMSVNGSSFSHMRSLSELKLNKQFYVFGREPLAKDVMQLELGSFQGLETSLRKLNLDCTPLYVNQFWDAIRPLKNIEELLANKARITHLKDNGFSANTKLAKIELGQNGISEVTQLSMWSLKNTLQSLSLHNNPIKTISECTFKNFPRLNYLSLHFCPLHCDCRLRWLQEFITKKQINASIYEYMYVCNEPSQLHGKWLSKIQKADLVCSVSQPEVCITPTPITTENPVTDSTTSTSMSKITVPISNKLSIVVASTKESIIITWNVQDPTLVTGYVLEYFLLPHDKNKQIIKIHKDNLVHRLTNLEPGMFYKICVIAEVNNVVHEDVESCKVIQTLSEATDTDSFHNTENDQDSGKDKNIIIGAVLASVVVVILITVGIYSIVKYKLQKLQLSMERQVPRVLFASNEGLFEDNDKKCAIYTVGNVYTDIKDAQQSSNYSTVDPKMMLKLSEGKDKRERSYSTYQKVRRPNKHKDQAEPVPAENQAAEEGFQGDKDNLGSRHSAPSRIEDRQSDNRRSRPLPALPATVHHDKQNKTKDREEKTNQNRHQVLTQASVYENKCNRSTDLLCPDTDDDNYEKP